MKTKYELGRMLYMVFPGDGKICEAPVTRIEKTSRGIEYRIGDTNWTTDYFLESSGKLPHNVYETREDAQEALTAWQTEKNRSFAYCPGELMWAVIGRPRNLSAVGDLSRATAQDAHLSIPGIVHVSIAEYLYFAGADGVPVYTCQHADACQVSPWDQTRLFIPEPVLFRDRKDAEDMLFSEYRQLVESMGWKLSRKRKETDE